MMLCDSSEDHTDILWHLDEFDVIGDEIPPAGGRGAGWGATGDKPVL